MLETLHQSVTWNHFVVVISTEGPLVEISASLLVIFNAVSKYSFMLGNIFLGWDVKVNHRFFLRLSEFVIEYHHPILQAM
jgi:hypothetical protein